MPSTFEEGRCPKRETGRSSPLWAMIGRIRGWFAPSEGSIPELSLETVIVHFRLYILHFNPDPADDEADWELSNILIRYKCASLSP
jgi:hypothetical protein